MKRGERWKCRAVENEENQPQVSLFSHRPWKSLRASHIPTAPTTPWKSGNPKTGFPLSHGSGFSLTNQNRKEAWRRIASLPPSGSFLDEKMLFQSCLMQDEPEPGVCFSHKVSLKGRSRMLGIDDQRAIKRTIEPGADPGVFGGQRGSAVRRPESEGGIRLGEPDAATAELRRVGTG